jgi:two-component system osmolarity sensor histidine kinase EnvZ
MVRLEVRDRGRGLRGASTPPFDDTQGRGLGLEIVRSLVRLNRGRFEIIPRQGGGMIARVELPMAPELPA